MSHLHSSWLDLPSLSLLQRLLLLLSSHSDEQSKDPRTAGRFNRLTMLQSPFTDYGSHLIVELSIQFRRGHHYYTFVFESGWNTKRRKTDFTVSLQKREGSAVLARICHSIRKIYVKRKSSRDPRSVQETHKTSERIRNEELEVRDHLHLQADESVEGEQASLSRMSEAEFYTGLLVE